MPKFGEPFCPWKRFHVLATPDSMLENPELPAAAKLIYGRICRYIGEMNLRCWPTPSALGKKVGLGERQVQKHLALLEKEDYIRRVARFENGEQGSNYIYVLWHPSFGNEKGLGNERSRNHMKKTEEIKERLARIRAANQAPWIRPDGTVNLGDPRAYGLTSWDEQKKPE